ncbi:MAG TPA: hypothetical protein VNG90_01005 [Candidatus Acidoferrum sp.]|nr:hypothetical protein [Candidatus Acidoferrum sp.]
MQQKVPYWQIGICVSLDNVKVGSAPASDVTRENAKRAIQSLMASYNLTIVPGAWAVYVRENGLANTEDIFRFANLTHPDLSLTLPALWWVGIHTTGEELDIVELVAPPNPFNRDSALQAVFTVMQKHSVTYAVYAWAMYADEENIVDLFKSCQHRFAADELILLKKQPPE